MSPQVFTAGGVLIDKSSSSSFGSTLKYSKETHLSHLNHSAQQNEQQQHQQMQQIQQTKRVQEEDTNNLATLLAEAQDSEEDEDEDDDDDNSSSDEFEDEFENENDIEIQSGEIDESEDEEGDEKLALLTHHPYNTATSSTPYQHRTPLIAAVVDTSHNGTVVASSHLHEGGSIQDLYTIKHHQDTKPLSNIIWLSICFFGIMLSFVGYGLLLEYSTSDGRQLHEMSFLFITSLLYTITAAAGRYVRDETSSTIPPARFALLGFTSMGSTWCSVRSLRFVIFPIQVLAKSCKPVPVMIMGAILGKRYSWRKYLNVFIIVAGVALFMGGGDTSNTNDKNKGDISNTHHSSSSSQWIGIILLFISLCFDGGTGAYEDKLMAVHSVGPFDLMYNIQLGKTILAGIGLIVFNQIHLFFQMCQQMGLILVALGLTGALGQVFIFVTIAKFGALTCSIIGLARKITTLLASILVYGHKLSLIQIIGLILSVGSMLMEFSGKKKGDVSDNHHPKLNPQTNVPNHEKTLELMESNRHPLCTDTDNQPNVNHPVIVDAEMSRGTTLTPPIKPNNIPPPNKVTVLTAGGS